MMLRQVVMPAKISQHKVAARQVKHSNFTMLETAICPATVFESLLVIRNEACHASLLNQYSRERFLAEVWSRVIVVLLCRSAHFKLG